jgi:hypothetical protein
LSPALHDGSTRLIAIDVKIETLLAKRFLGLANGRIFGTAKQPRRAIGASAISITMQGFCSLPPS